MVRREIGPQPGPQTDFLDTLADIAIFGGAAGGGKSYALLLEAARHYKNPRFGAVIFRRSTVQVRNEGGLWDESMALFSQLQGHPREAYLEWEFPEGSRLKFAHLENDKTVYDWQGSQIAYLGFDELTHFTEKQFFYMMSRNRSASGVPGYIRATCNPDSDSWVRKFIDWWIDRETGLAIKARAGKLRWFIRQNDVMVWADSKEEIFAKYGPDQLPKSVTFIPSSIYDNKILMKNDPSYLSNLMALSRVERMRLLGGNWNVRASAGMMFRREWFKVVDVMPSPDVNKVQRTIRAWDKAATEVSPHNPNPDWTRGVKMHRMQNGQFIISHVASTRSTPLGVEQLVKNIASQDGRSTLISIAQDPGSSGVADKDNFVRLLAGYIIRINKPHSDKITRAKPLSAQCEAGNVLLLRGAWNEDFLDELEAFDGENGHDDQVDAAADAFNEICGSLSLLNVL